MKQSIFPPAPPKFSLDSQIENIDNNSEKKDYLRGNCKVWYLEKGFGFIKCRK